ncbi:MAG: glutathione S-transferase [Devosia sp.]|nr:glutathione S-transferase [Devosia sp.]
MIDFYFHATPNSMKVTVMLQEVGVPFTVKPVDIFKGDQHTPAFKAINPNAKVPAIVDGGTTIFDSHAILLYLATSMAPLSQRTAPNTRPCCRGCNWWQPACRRFGPGHTLQALGG